jgi:DNA mismatch repair protein MutL
MARIRILPPETARLIAAGEVIDRPASVLREFLDNAIDSGASEISAEIEGGGTDLVRVVDDGCGMDAEDLGLSVLAHATSKIAAADDLLSVRSLGFRGEALASIAAVARLEITSRDGSSAEAYRLSAGPGIETEICPAPGRRGTAAQASRLFEDYPARRQFLKRAQAEGMLCRQVFVDKAIANPGLAFRYSSDGRLVFSLRPEEPELRVSGLFGELDKGLVYRVRFSGPACQGSVIIASPALYRNDRRLMQVFVNRRRVQDAGLLQALDYAFSGFLPGGAHPAAFLLADVDPAFADFNIHPAKREVRLKDQAGLRHAFVEAVRAFLLELSRHDPSRLAPSATSSAFDYGFSREFDGGEGRRPSGWDPVSTAEGPTREAFDRKSWDDLADLRERLAPRLPSAREDGGDVEGGAPRYLGKALGLFLAVEWKDALYLIDQHAAHERLLYDELMAAPPHSQELLVPAVFEAEDDAEDALIAAAAPELVRLGFGLAREGGRWMVTALPSPLDRDPVGAVKEIAAAAGGRTGPAAAGGATRRDPIRGARAAALATAACRAAVKDGDELEPEAAAELARRALGLPEPRCPHGRPVWVRLSREDLFKLVRRII